MNLKRTLQMQIQKDWYRSAVRLCCVSLLQDALNITLSVRPRVEKAKQFTESGLFDQRARARHRPSSRAENLSRFNHYSTSRTGPGEFSTVIS